MVASLKLNHGVASGEAARKADGGHCRLAAGVDDADALHRGHCGLQGFGEFALQLGGGAEAESGVGGGFDGGDDFGMRVSGDVGAPGVDIVDELVAVGVPQEGSFGAGDEERVAADGFEGAHGGVHPAGNGLHGARKQRAGGVGFHEGDSIRFFGEGEMRGGICQAALGETHRRIPKRLACETISRIIRFSFPH